MSNNGGDAMEDELRLLVARAARPVRPEDSGFTLVSPDSGQTILAWTRGRDGVEHWHGDEKLEHAARARLRCGTVTRVAPWWTHDVRPGAEDGRDSTDVFVAARSAAPAGTVTAWAKGISAIAS